MCNQIARMDPDLPGPSVVLTDQRCFTCTPPPARPSGSLHRGLVTRERSTEDERTVHLRLTEAGHALEHPARGVSAPSDADRPRCARRPARRSEVQG